MDSEILKILKMLKRLLKTTNLDCYFLCNLLALDNEDDMDVFQEYLYNNIEGIVLPDTECTYKEHMESDDFVDDQYPAVWPAFEYVGRMNWLDKHIKLLEENGY